MSINIRDYQQKVIDEILNSDSNEFIISNPTGTGKGIIFVELMKEYEKKGVRTLYITAYGVMIEDIPKRFDKDINIIKSGSDKTTDSLCYVATMQTLQNRLEKHNELKNCVILMDEQKAYEQKMYKKIIDFIKPQRIIHSTATPYNSKGVILYPDAKNIKTITIKEAEERGYRVPLKTYVPSFTNELNFDEIEKSGADYNQEQVGQLMSEKWFLNDFKKWINSLDLKNRATLIICTTIEQVEMIYKLIKATEAQIKKKNKKIYLT